MAKQDMQTCLDMQIVELENPLKELRSAEHVYRGTQPRRIGTHTGFRYGDNERRQPMAGREATTFCIPCTAIPCVATIPATRSTTSS
jgi:hypothetical protein